MITEVSYKPGQVIRSTISLPASKSFSNRALIIHAIGNLNSPIHNLSTSSDTVTLNNILSAPGTHVNAGDGGTTLRFLLAYFCLKGKEIILDGSQSLKNRPVSELVNALKSIGANIEYLEEENRLPLKIHSSKLQGGSISISGETSSQFISALMMIAPYLDNGLQIEITGEILSLPYIQMTKSVMEYFGVPVSFDNNIVRINKGIYSNSELHVEPDWSAASYWYEFVALSEDATISLPGLKQLSLQGDCIIASMMERFGVSTRFDKSGAEISKVKNFKLPEYFSADFTGCPDLGPAVAATCAGLNITADLIGLKNFRLKESDRAVALQRELYNMNVKTDFCGGSKFKVYEGNGMQLWNRPVNTYNDHRIAMAFAPLAVKTGKVLIDNARVVEKSYPQFFEDLRLAGFTMNVKC